MPARLLLLLLYLLLFIQADLQAQVKPAEIKQALLPTKGIYRFPAFTEGTVVFRNGIVSASRLNYNISLDEMHFISQNGDTLSLADPVTIDFISLNNRRFYYNKGYLQTADSIYDGIILAYKQTLAAQQERHGGYGIERLHEGVRSYSYFTGNGQKYKLGEDEAILVTAQEYFFFGDQYGHFSKASKDLIFRQYETKQGSIKDFIKMHHTNFNVEQDLVKLLQFCRQL